jgi:hypothetical protein
MWRILLAEDAEGCGGREGKVQSLDCSVQDAVTVTVPLREHFDEDRETLNRAEQSRAKRDGRRTEMGIRRRGIGTGRRGTETRSIEAEVENKSTFHLPAAYPRISCQCSDTTRPSLR